MSYHTMRRIKFCYNLLSVLSIVGLLITIGFIFIISNSFQYLAILSIAGILAVLYAFSAYRADEYEQRIEETWGHK